MLDVAIQRGLRDFVLETEFTVNNGETFVLVGENGAGKSSLLLLMSGLLTPESGYIRLDGRALYDSRDRINVPTEERDIGLVFQNYALFPHLTVSENVAFGLRRRKLPNPKIHEKVEDVLTLLSLENLATVRSDQLSGGQRQRVALARALVLSSSLLLLDEPISALDASARERMRSELRAYVRKSNVPCVIVTHSFQDALSLGDQIGVMEKGRIVQNGPLKEIMMNKNHFMNHFFCECREVTCHR
jgi:molybdate transport system ATP-binding protein